MGGKKYTGAAYITEDSIRSIKQPDCNMKGLNTHIFYRPQNIDEEVTQPVFFPAHITWTSSEHRTHALPYLTHQQSVVTMAQSR